MNLSVLWLTEPLRALRMPDEFTFVVGKAALVVASAVGVVLSLAWLAVTKCFREPPVWQFTRLFRDRPSKLLSSQG